MPVREDTAGRGGSGVFSGPELSSSNANSWIPGDVLQARYGVLAGCMCSVCAGGPPSAQRAQPGHVAAPPRASHPSLARMAFSFACDSYARRLSADVMIHAATGQRRRVDRLPPACRGPAPTHPHCPIHGLALPRAQALLPYPRVKTPWRSPQWTRDNPWNRKVTDTNL
jgi:hypothetical protein